MGIPKVRATLSDYVAAVHTPFGLLGISPYRAYGNLGEVLNAPRVTYPGPAEAVTHDQIDQAVRDIDDLSATSSPIGVPAMHPWRDASKTFYSEDDLDVVRSCASRLLEQSRELIEFSEQIEGLFGVPPISRLADIEVATEIAGVLKRSPGAPLAVLSSDAWNTPPLEATALIERAREYGNLKSRVGAHFTDEVLQQDHANDIAYVEDKSQGFLSFLSFLDGRYRAIKRRWLAYRLPSNKCTLIDQANEMKYVDRLRELRSSIGQADEKGRELFGALWQGENTSCDGLESYIKWVVEMRALCVSYCLNNKALEIASSPSPNISDVERLRQMAGDLSSSLDAMRKAVGWPNDYVAEAPLSEIRDRSEELLKNVHLGPQWDAFEGAT